MTAREMSGPDPDLVPEGYPPEELTSISVFFPCYNDAGTIASLVFKADRVCRELGVPYEIIVVDDGSTDGSRQILADVAAVLPSLRLVEHPKNRGYGGALRTGFDESRFDWVFYTDGDFQYDVAELPSLIRRISPDIDWVQGFKISRQDPLHRRVIGRIYHHTVAFAFSLRMRDTDCDFRLIRKNLLEKVDLQNDSGVICVEMMRSFQDAGGEFVEVPVNHYFRAYGKSQFFNFRRLARVGIDLLRLWFRLVVAPLFRNAGRRAFETRSGG